MDIQHLAPQQQMLPEQALEFLPELDLDVLQALTTKPAGISLTITVFVISALIHGATLYFWPEDNTQQRFNADLANNQTSTIKVTLNTTTTANQKAKKPVPEPTPIKKALPTKPATKSITPTRSRPDNLSQNAVANDPPPATLPTSPKLAPSVPASSRVFHPRLQQQLKQAKAKRLRLQSEYGGDNATWKNAGGSTVVDLDYRS
jgi:type IV secretory pathway VirB10-like protein